MNIQTSLNTDIGLPRENVALSAVKHNAEQAQRMNEIAQKTTQSATTANETRGTILDILV